MRAYSFKKGHCIFGEVCSILGDPGRGTPGATEETAVHLKLAAMESDKHKVRGMPIPPGF